MTRRRPHLPPRLPGPTGRLSIGLMGGSFDPPHDGHAHVIETARRQLGLDWVWVLPAAGNPLKRTATSFGDRFAAASRRLSGRRTRVSSLEADLGLTYTIDMIRALKRLAPNARFVWIMGADNLAQFHLWRSWSQIARLVPIAIVARPGASPKAGLSRFARQFANRRLPPAAATALTRTSAPAWIHLVAPLDDSSSGAIRAHILAASIPPI